MLRFAPDSRNDAALGVPQALPLQLLPTPELHNQKTLVCFRLLSSIRAFILFVVSQVRAVLWWNGFLVLLLAVAGVDGQMRMQM
jgi:hypothetical protein